jgi:hypothetical protein
VLIRSLLVIVLVALLATLTSLAFASAPDPLWIGGFWDDDDFDDAVIVITGKTPALAATVVLEAGPTGALAPLPDARQPFITAAPRPTFDSRAPPPVVRHNSPNLG